MIVKCKKLCHHVHGYVDGPSDRDVTINRLYFVIGISFGGNDVSIRIIDNNTDNIFEKYSSQIRNLSDFEVIDSNIPPFWHYSHHKILIGVGSLEPKDWSYYDEEREKDFLDDYWDGDPDAIDTYERDVERLLDMHREKYDVDRILKGFIDETDEDIEKIKK